MARSAVSHTSAAFWGVRSILCLLVFGGGILDALDASFFSRAVGRLNELGKGQVRQVLPSSVAVVSVDVLPYYPLPTSAGVAPRSVGALKKGERVIVTRRDHGKVFFDMRGESVWTKASALRF